MPPKIATIDKTKSALSLDEETAGVCTSAMYLRYSSGHAGRAGGNRTPNLRFWRPPLCQLSYCPVQVLTHTLTGSKRPRPIKLRIKQSPWPPHLHRRFYPPPGCRTAAPPPSRSC